MRVFIPIICLLILTHCSKDSPDIITDENGVIISRPYIWRIDLSQSTYIGGHYSQSIIYDNTIVLGAQNETDIAYLVNVEIDEGDIIWESEYIEQYDFFSINYAYQHNELFTARDGTKIYQINLRTGIYEWELHGLSGAAWEWITGIDSLLFIFSIDPYPEFGYPVISAHYGNISNGNTNLFLIPDLGDLPEPDLDRVSFAIGGFRYIKPFKNEANNNIMLLCYYMKNYYLPGGGEEQVSQSYVGLYNFTNREWVYERTELGDYRWLEGFTPTIVDDRFYHTLADGVTECRVLYTGELVWKNVDPHQYAFTGFVIAEGKMIVCDDWNENIIAFDIDNGREVWRTPTASNISIPNYLNGIVYYASRGDGRIYALDAETGEKLWRLKSPDSQRDTYDFFKKECHVFPGENGEKGRIIVSSYTHGYCYEAIR